MKSIFNVKNVSYISESYKKKKSPGNYKKGVKIFPLFLVCHEYPWVKFIQANVVSAVQVIIGCDSFLLEDKVTFLSFNKCKIELWKV